MLKRIYIDNFRGLVNFELSINAINLFLGPNSSGKSTIFDVLRTVQAFASGNQKASYFRPEDLTRWQNSSVQRFEIDIESSQGLYKYELAIEHNKGTQRRRMHYERLWFNDNPLMKFEPSGEAHLFRDDHSEGPAYTFDWSQSLLASIPPGKDNTLLTWFKERLSRLIVVQIMPPTMQKDSGEEAASLSYRAENFVSWYRYISQDQGKAIMITEVLKDILDGFKNFKFDPVGEHLRLLKLSFASSNDDTSGNTIDYHFNELSDGQRMLIALYTLITYCQSGDYTICIDEPENFLALPEIQPWLTTLYDFCNEDALQAILISHHPELIDYLAASAGYWFESQSNAPVRVRKIAADGKDSLKLSELVSRGWLYD